MLIQISVYIAFILPQEFNISSTTGLLGIDYLIIIRKSLCIFVYETVWIVLSSHMLLYFKDAAPLFPGLNCSDKKFTIIFIFFPLHVMYVCVCVCVFLPSWLTLCFWFLEVWIWCVYVYHFSFYSNLSYLMVSELPWFVVSYLSLMLETSQPLYLQTLQSFSSFGIPNI